MGHAYTNMARDCKDVNLYFDDLWNIVSKKSLVSLIYICRERELYIKIRSVFVFLYPRVDKKRDSLICIKPDSNLPVLRKPLIFN